MSRKMTLTLLGGGALLVLAFAFVSCSGSSTTPAKTGSVTLKVASS